MRLPFLRSKSDAGASAERADRSVDDPGALQAARTQARRRLIGALVLLLSAVVGFPLLFETQPRPLPGAVAIDGSGLVIRAEPGARTGSTGATATRTAPLPPRAASAAEPGAGRMLATPSAGSAAGSSATPPPVVAAAATPEVTAAAETTAAASAPLATASQSVAKAPAKAASMAAAPSTGKALVAAAVTAAAATAVLATPAASSAGKAAAAKKTDAPASAPKAAPAKPATAEATPAMPAAASAPAATPNVRWVVQVGAYNDMERMRQARQKAEKLGFKTYITDVDTPTGKRTRVRLGPFATKKEAETAAAKVKANGMAANVLSV